jgi:hypothetical protein
MVIGGYFQIQLLNLNLLNSLNPACGRQALKQK